MWYPYLNEKGYGYYMKVRRHGTNYLMIQYQVEVTVTLPQEVLVTVTLPDTTSNKLLVKYVRQGPSAVPASHDLTNVIYRGVAGREKGG